MQKQNMCQYIDRIGSQMRELSDKFGSETEKIVSLKKLNKSLEDAVRVWKF